jgi:integrase
MAGMLSAERADILFPSQIEDFKPKVLIAAQVKSFDSRARGAAGTLRQRAGREQPGARLLVAQQRQETVSLSGHCAAELEHIEDKRKNAAVTRNVRLAAIKCFFRFLEYRQPAALEQVRRVLATPFKRTDTRLVPYLLREELQALLDAPDPATRDGIRDRAMLHLAVCAGLRVSELTGLKLDAMRYCIRRTEAGVGRPAVRLDVSLQRRRD